jgi:hypothetical protein
MRIVARCQKKKKVNQRKSEDGSHAGKELQGTINLGLTEKDGGRKTSAPQKTKQ